MKPVIYLNIYDIERLFKNNCHLYNRAEELRIKVKEASGYQLDNSNFIIEDTCGNPAMTIAFHPKFYSLYHAKYHDQIAIIEYDNLNSIEFIKEAIEQIENDNVYCLECETWVDIVNSTHFSFAGRVCKGCYNPEKHLPPDTRGD